MRVQYTKEAWPFLSFQYIFDVKFWIYLPRPSHIRSNPLDLWLTQNQIYLSFDSWDIGLSGILQTLFLADKEIFFWKNSWIFQVSYFNSGNLRQNKPMEILENCVRRLGNSMAKNQDLWKPCMICSWSPREIPFCF